MIAVRGFDHRSASNIRWRLGIPGVYYADRVTLMINGKIMARVGKFDFPLRT